MSQVLCVLLASVDTDNCRPLKLYLQLHTVITTILPRFTGAMSVLCVCVSRVIKCVLVLRIPLLTIAIIGLRLSNRQTLLAFVLDPNCQIACKHLCLLV
jgi:hypothetical protein